MTTTSRPLVAAVEDGGTKCIAVLAKGSDIVERRQWPTETPDVTLPLLADAMKTWNGVEAIAALGIASFGPIDLAPVSRTFGHILRTPKPGWSGVDVRSALSEGLNIPTGLETDVGGAALAEGLWGASIGCHTHVYLTVGTGIGAGIVTNGLPVHGALHPEIGHARVRRHPDDGFPGICPFHGDCLEGLASGPAIAARAGMPAEVIGMNDPLWTRVASELAELIDFLRLTLAPQRIVMGGGVIDGQPGLLAKVVQRAEELAAGYPTDKQARNLRSIVVAPVLGANAGSMGAIAVALRALGVNT